MLVHLAIFTPELSAKQTLPTSYFLDAEYSSIPKIVLNQ